MKTTLLLTTATALAFGGVAPATAGTWRGSDPRGDVRSIPVGDPARATETPKHPRRTLGDITAVRVTHTASTVRVRIQMRDLRKEQGPHVFAVDIRAPYVADKPTGPGEVPPPVVPYDDYSAFFSAGPGGQGVPAGHPWTGSAVSVYKNGTKPVACTATRTIDYRANTVLIVVPRRCLGRPAWIRAAASATTNAKSSRSVFWDDARMSPRLKPEA